MQDDLGFSSEIVAEGDTENLIKSFLVYGIGELELCYVHIFYFIQSQMLLVELSISFIVLFYQCLLTFNFLSPSVSIKAIRGAPNRLHRRQTW